MKRTIQLGAGALVSTIIIFVSSAMNPFGGGYSIARAGQAAWKTSGETASGVYTGQFTSMSEFAMGRSEARNLSQSIQDMKDPPVAASAPSPAPESTLAATPKPTPRATPLATPRPTPKPTPKPPPIPTPTSTPTPLPSSTPAPSVSGKAAEVISTAKSLIGIPYVWGGTTTSGFDCSGFIQYVFDRNGINMPRTAAEQYTMGESISKGELKPGDLIFFQTYKEGASHVGIYLGNNQFIHASSGGGEVTISNMTSPYYTQHYYGSRRLIN